MLKGRSFIPTRETPDTSAEGAEGGGGGNGAEGGSAAPTWHGLTPDVMVDHSSGRIPAAEHPIIKDTPDGPTAAMRLINAQREIGQRIKIPGENATTQELGEFYTKLGRPESPDSYKWEAPEGEEAHEPTMKAMKETAFTSGLSQRQFNDLVTSFNGQMSKMIEERQESLKAEADAQFEAMKTRWGDKYEENVENAKRYLQERFANNPETIQRWEDKGWANDPALIDMAAELGATRREHNPEVRGQEAPDAKRHAQDEVARMRSDPTHPKYHAFNNDGPGHAEAVEYFASQMKKIHGNDPEVEKREREEAEADRQGLTYGA